MIMLSGVLKDVKKIDYQTKDNLSKSRYELLVDVGYLYPVKMRVQILPSDYIVGKKIELEVFSNAWSISEKRYIPVAYYPVEKK